MNIVSLKKSEMKDINGGSEITDAFWYGLGYAIGFVKNRIEFTYSTGVFK